MRRHISWLLVGILLVSVVAAGCEPASTPEAVKETVEITRAVPATVKPTQTVSAPASVEPTLPAPAPATAEPTLPATAGATEVTPSASAGGEGTPPVADFTAEAIGGTGPLEGPPPLTVRFTDLSTGEITSWSWDFGDGTTSTEQNPEHTFEQCPGEKGLCTVSLTVCGPGGCDTETKEDYLWVSESCTGC